MPSSAVSDPLAPDGDFSNGFAAVRRRLAQGESPGYAAFIRSLGPRWTRVAADLALAYAMIGGGVALALAPVPGPVAGVVLTLAAGALLGVAIAFLNLFLHEAAHYNIHPVRRVNDLLADALIGIWVGVAAGPYRRLHFEHHRALGTTADTERTYFHALTPRFLFECLVGIHVVRTLLLRRRIGVADPAAARMLLVSVAFHLLVLGLAAAAGAWRLVGAWLIAIGMVFPFLAALRQLLEHRDVAADPARDYAGVDHGAVTRLFDDGALGRLIGGAGFNRHLLHHWEPQVSYTRLAELDAYLSQTSLDAILAARRTTYPRAFLALLRSASGRSAAP